MLAPAEKLREREQVPDFWLCAALLKKDRFDLVLEKASELGVRRIQPVLTRRCVADKLNPSARARSSPKRPSNARRTALPELAEPVKLDALLRDWPAERTLFFADEQGGEPAAEAFAAHPGPAALLIGPEGGFDDAERAAIRALPQARRDLARPAHPARRDRRDRRHRAVDGDRGRLVAVSAAQRRFASKSGATSAHPR